MHNGRDIDVVGHADGLGHRDGMSTHQRSMRSSHARSNEASSIILVYDAWRELLQNMVFAITVLWR